MLGLTFAGVFVYVKYRDRAGEITLDAVLKHLNVLGLLLVFYTFLLRRFSLIPFVANAEAMPDSYWTWLLFRAIAGSIGIGFVFIFAFFSLGLVYCLLYKKYVSRAPRLYFLDLSGASSGCVFATLILNFLQPSSALILLTLIVFCLACVYAFHIKHRYAAGVSIVTAACSVLFLINTWTGFLEVKIKDYHSYWSKAMPFYEEVWHRWNVYSRVSLFHNTKPESFREAEYTFSIATGMAKVVPFYHDKSYFLEAEYYPGSGSSFSFLTQRPKDVLVLMAGAGRDMVEVYRYSGGKADITGVELNPLVINKAKVIPGSNLDVFFRLPNVHMINREGRSYIESTEKKFDSIILSWSGASEMQYLGMSGYTPQYLYTVEAFGSYLRHLNPGGTIVVLDRNKIKILATIKAAFMKIGVRDIARKVIMIAGGNNVKFLDGTNDWIGLVVKNSDFSKEEIEKIRLKLLPYGQFMLYQPYEADGSSELCRIYESLLKRDDLDIFLQELSRKYNKNFSIASDDKPFMDIMNISPRLFHVRRWPSFLNNAQSLDKRKETFIHSFNYFIGIVLVAGLLFIVMPLIFRAKKDLFAVDYRALGYFALLGLGFMLVEVTIMHSFTLLLGNPIYSFAVVLASLLLSGGAGSWLSERLFRNGAVNLRRLCIGASVVLCCYFILIPAAIRDLLGVQLWGKFIITAVFIFPLGVILGMFFPQGLRALGEENKDLVPLAWGINGYMSMVGSLLCIVLSRTLGFSVFFLYASFVYLLIIFFHPGGSSGRRTNCMKT